jgi:thiamine biosynthesis lipoprotein
MTAAASMAAPPTPAFDRFGIWGTSAVVGVADPLQLAVARSMLDEELALIEQAASRFRPGTEILALNAAAGTGPVVVTPVLLDLVRCALSADAMTDGACDPTVGDALIALGYDRDFDELGHADPTLEVEPAPGTSGITIDVGASTVALPAGVHLDLGATAKARAADRAAERIAAELGCGVLVDLGGDLRTAGTPPADGWQIGITTEARTGSTDHVDEVITVTAGAVASSSTSVRTWRRGDEVAHHVIDPATGSPAARVWSMVTVAASTCVMANSLSTAALVWGEDALFELPQRSMAARLVRIDGTIERVGGWPEPIGQTDLR